MAYRLGPKELMGVVVMREVITIASIWPLTIHAVHVDPAVPRRVHPHAVDVEPLVHRIVCRPADVAEPINKFETLTVGI